MSTVLYVCLLERIRYIHTKDRHYVGTVLCDSVCSQSGSFLTAIVYHPVFQFSLVTRLQAGQSGSNPGRRKILLHNAQTGSRLTHTPIEE
jgi:hypothetical protein